MNAAAKLLASMRRFQLDWQIGELQTIARQTGIDWRHQKSSHCVFIQDGGEPFPYQRTDPSNQSTCGSSSN